MRINPATALVLSAVLFGAGLAIHEKREGPPVAPVPASVRHTPAPEPAMPQKAAQASAYVDRAPSCVVPSNAAGYCWYEGWAFTKKTICLDSSIPNARVATLVSELTGVGGLKLVNGGAAGGCASKGYPASQRVSFLSMSATGVKNSGGACATTAPANYGNLNSVQINVNVTGPTATPCGGEPEWTDVFRHEFGHALGLTHEQRYVTSLMRDGHSADAEDKAHLTQIYSYRSL